MKEWVIAWSVGMAVLALVMETVHHHKGIAERR